MSDAECRRHAEEFIRSFIVSAKRARYLELLDSERGSLKLRAELYHFNKRLDQQKCTPFPREVFAGMSPMRLIEFLFAEGAPARCVFMSATRPCVLLDVKSALLASSLVFVGVISAVPGRLAFYFGESHEQYRVLKS